MRQGGVYEVQIWCCPMLNEWIIQNDSSQNEARNWFLNGNCLRFLKHFFSRYSYFHAYIRKALSFVTKRVLYTVYISTFLSYFRLLQYFFVMPFDWMDRKYFHELITLNSPFYRIKIDFVLSDNSIFWICLTNKIS